jgi:hypothetical protein
VNTQAATVAAEVPAVACCLNVAPTLHREHSFDLETSKMSGYPPPQSAPDAAGHAAAQHAAGMPAIKVMHSSSWVSSTRQRSTTLYVRWELILSVLHAAATYGVCSGVIQLLPPTAGDAGHAGEPGGIQE